MSKPAICVSHSLVGGRGVGEMGGGGAKTIFFRTLTVLAAYHLPLKLKVPHGLAVNIKDF